MVTTADVVAAPRNRPIREFEYICGHCGHPLVPVRDRAVTVLVHARHASWLKDRHLAQPL